MRALYIPYGQQLRSLSAYSRWRCGHPLGPRALGHWWNSALTLCVNPTGSFTHGGPSADAGVPGYEAVPYYTISVASKVPRDIVQKLNADLDAVLKLPELAPRWAELGITPLGGSPEAAVKRNAVETETWTRVIRAAGIRAD